MPDNSADVKVGKLIAILVEKGEDWKNVQVPKSEETSATSDKPAESKPKEAKPDNEPKHTEQVQQ